MASAGSPVDRLPPPFPVEAEAAEASPGDPQPDSDSDGEDIFTGNASKPEFPKKESPVPPENSLKTNGIQEEQDNLDLFADATVELSLDNTQNHPKKETTPELSPVPSLEKPTPSSSKQQSKSEEEVGTCVFG
ncbi:PREDICTED: sorting nexin-1-like [Thamnophis sirtalis]|uniref:Sorting nexin-1-like n=1 Tax=Thamnophis sirtalis TaxID=35019 RepID=A0A6I9Y463_9SAUR|nr:PREDICTED: sorting nexin-1-like [Thamnophis sirtalis]